LLKILMKFVETSRENQISPTRHKNAKIQCVPITLMLLCVPENKTSLA